MDIQMYKIFHWSNLLIVVIGAKEKTTPDILWQRRVLMIIFLEKII